jgi:uncharacterized delta-60 repeat protein
MKTITHSAGNWLLATRDYALLFGLVLTICTSVFAEAPPIEEWVALYSVPGAGYDLAIDNSGNVYVTGFSMGIGYDYATIKYSPDGNQLWVANYNGPWNGDDSANALAIDNSGNVYVTGYSMGNGLVFDYATIKYSPDGNQLWVARYNGDANYNDQATALAVDNSGNVYVTGYSDSNNGTYDYATVKYSPDGNQLWVARYNGPGNSSDYADALKIDSSGNVYVTGYSIGSGTGYDYATIKYSPDGNQLWVARYNGPGNNRDIANALAIDNSGNVYVTGYCKAGSGLDFDYATIKYSPDGNQLWVARYNGPGNSDDRANALAIDSSGNVYVTGYSTGSGTGYDYATVKYSPDGNQLWVARYNGPGNSSDYADALKIDSSGNVYVTGYSTGSGTGYDYATIKYSPDGNQLWVACYSGPGNSDDRANALKIDSLGNVYVTGYSLGDTSYYTTIKYKQEHCSNVMYVDANATGANNGTSWANAYKYLQNALTAATSGYDIWVAQGTYRPDRDTAHPGGTSSRTATFQLKNGVALYGGFPSGGGWSSRDPNSHQTILSGDIGVAGNNSDNSYNVVTCYNLNSSAILDGFTITAGNANGNVGGGMSNGYSSPTVTNCSFFSNSAGAGGGMYNYSSSPMLTNCTFTGNLADWSGGGMFNNNGSSPTLTNCTFSGNSAPSGSGGGMYNIEGGSPTTINCAFIGNLALYNGGGICADFCGVPTRCLLINCSFSGNSSGYGSSGISASGSIIDLGAGGSNSTTDEFYFGEQSRLQGTGGIVISLGGKMIIDSDAVVDLNDPNDPNVKGTIQCDGLLKVQGNGQLKHATVNVSRQAGGYFGKFQVEDSATATNLDIYTNGDRFMDVNSSTFTGIIANNRIYVTITEGQNGTDEGVLELRGRDLPSHPCDFNDVNVLGCYLDSNTMPAFDTNSWTLERLEVAAGAKVTLVDRSDSGNGYPEVLYVKNLVLDANCVLDAGFEHLYYTNLTGDPNLIKKGAVLGFSLGKVDFDSNAEYQSRVSNNNYIDPVDPNNNRIRVERVTGQGPDPNGMMTLHNFGGGGLLTTGYGLNNIGTSGQTINARAKAQFAECYEDRIRIRFNYLFDTTDTGTYLNVYLSDVPELLDSDDPSRGQHYLYVGQVFAPPTPRPGSAGGGRFGNFDMFVSTGDLYLCDGTWVELELFGPASGQGQLFAIDSDKQTPIKAASGSGGGGASASVDDWDAGIYCYGGVCLDVDHTGIVTTGDLLKVVSGTGGFGTTDTSCLDGGFATDGYTDEYDISSWDWTLNLNTRENLCGEIPIRGGVSGLGFSGLASSSSSNPEPLGLSGLDDLLISGKRGTPGYSTLLMDQLYVFNSNYLYLRLLNTVPNRCNVRIVRGTSDDLYQVNSESGVLRLDDTHASIVPPGQTYVDSEPRYGQSATVYVGIQGTNDNPYGRPIFDAAFDASYVYIVPVVVVPNGDIPYAAAAKLQLDTHSTPPYHVVELFDGPLLINDNQRECRNNLRDIELDAAGNVYVTNANAMNESDILWKFEPDGVVLRRLNLSEPDGPLSVRAPSAMCVSSATNTLYLTSSIYCGAGHNSSVIYGLSTGNLNLVRTITISGMQHITSITEDPVTKSLWVAGFNFNSTPNPPISPLAAPFYDPYMAKVPLGANNASAVCILGANDLAMPLSICWTGALPPPVKCGGADLNKNGTVNMQDLAILAKYWLRTDCFAFSNCEGADLEPQGNPDGDVDLKDFDVFADHWLETNCQ